ncbi:hypothetical protein BBK14_04695 [Parafrankia soli]|uniref:Uncharacterized protein n=1 Tax=Parafrankia soli TaxID=2599596 RepID=A0A1S1PWZ2_9ACTN|nr:hypothetical protein BBK14_04695 [Parafrankia soli]
MIRPCRGRLGAAAHELWSAHLCGLCLALRAMRTARVVTAEDPGITLAASASLAAAAARIHDHARDGDGLAGTRLLRAGAARAAGAADRAADERAGHWNPLTASGTTDAAARSLCLDALTGLRLAVDELTLVPSADAALLRVLLVDELTHSVTRTFAGTAPAEGDGWWRRRRARRRARREHGGRRAGANAAETAAMRVRSATATVGAEIAVDPGTGRSRLAPPAGTPDR